MARTHPAGPKAILLAVAVHDDGQARLEPAAPDRVKVEAHSPLRFRISYRLADSARGRQEATVRGELRVGDRPPLHAEVAMHDRPVVNDSRQGDLEFDVGSLEPGLHTLRFHVHLETSDQDALLKDRPRLQSADVDGSIDVEAV